MHVLLNTLFLMTPRTLVRLDHETVKIEVEGELKMQVPLHHLGSIVCFGDVTLTTPLIMRCAEDKRLIVYHDQNGRFKARVEGPVSGNVFLRRAQHQVLTDSKMTTAIARNIVAGKIRNARQVVLRGAREADNEEDARFLQDTARELARGLDALAKTPDLEQIRGIEGNAARHYFATFDRMVRVNREAFRITHRNRRPPLDRMNALLSFIYALLLNDCLSAVEGVGLDPQVGYLHVLRSGRPALALDLMEEFRAVLADRLALTLINRRQVVEGDFIERPGGAVYINDNARKEIVIAYQKRKQEEVYHPVLDRKVPLGLVPHIQARLLARVLRGDAEEYLPFMYR
ncbi:type I-C CRISPR-associated endonuclease Cas1c [Moorella sulfitireducens (nom. illeg.)]|uniref:type I-C CRISPR-associated endonuclease Cas1c n=1 Tax=Neomoorella sulfitireducens TaxID=2972948 RepID=UPI0021AD32E6|nr:type I-C CRISPR-associated endonuclease Cas1c [Moorella sulfitireducens]